MSSCYSYTSFYINKVWCFIDNNERTLETFNFKEIALNVYIVSTTPRCYNFCQTLLVIQLSNVYTYFFLFFFVFFLFPLISINVSHSLTFNKNKQRLQYLNPLNGIFFKFSIFIFILQNNEYILPVIYPHSAKNWRSMILHY